MKINSSESPSVLLSPCELHFFPAATHLPTKATRCSPEDCCQYRIIEGELMSKHYRVSTERLNYYGNHGLFPWNFTHICTLSPTHVKPEEPQLYLEDWVFQLMHPFCFPQPTPPVSLPLKDTPRFWADQINFLICTYPIKNAPQPSL